MRQAWWLLFMCCAGVRHLVSVWLLLELRNEALQEAAGFWTHISQARLLLGLEGVVDEGHWTLDEIRYIVGAPVVSQDRALLLWVGLLIIAIVWLRVIIVDLLYLLAHVLLAEPFGARAVLAALRIRLVVREREVQHHQLAEVVACLRFQARFGLVEGQVLLEQVVHVLLCWQLSGSGTRSWELLLLLFLPE